MLVGGPTQSAPAGHSPGQLPQPLVPPTVDCKQARPDPALAVVAPDSDPALAVVAPDTAPALAVVAPDTAPALSVAEPELTLPVVEPEPELALPAAAPEPDPATALAVFPPQPIARRAVRKTDRTPIALTRAPSLPRSFTWCPGIRATSIVSAVTIGSDAIGVSQGPASEDPFERRCTLNADPNKTLPSIRSALTCISKTMSGSVIETLHPEDEQVQIGG